MNPQNSNNDGAINASGGVLSWDVWPVRTNGQLTNKPFVVSDEVIQVKYADTVASSETNEQRAVWTARKPGRYRYFVSRAQSTPINWKVPQISEFMRANPEIPQIVTESQSKISDAFGPVSLRLEIEKNSNGRNDAKLWVNIVSPFDPDETLSRFSAFEESWLIPQLHRFAGKLNFNLEFIDKL